MESTLHAPSILDWTEFMDWLLSHVWVSHRGIPRHRCSFRILIRSDLDTKATRIRVKEEHVTLPVWLYPRMLHRGASVVIVISPARRHLPKIEQAVELFADLVHWIFRKPRRLLLEIQLENFHLTQLRFRNELKVGPNGPWQMNGPPPEDWREQLGGLLASAVADLNGN